MRSDDLAEVSVSETDFEEEKYCSVMAVFGQIALEDNYSAQYGRDYIDNSVGRTVSDTMDILASTGYLDKKYIPSEDSYFFQLPEDDDVRDEAEEIADYINQHYDEKIFRFLDNFGEEDIEKLRLREVGLVYNL